MKYLSLCLSILILSSCSTIKRNGYYQTKNYKIGKNKIKEAFSKKENTANEQKYVALDLEHKNFEYVPNVHLSSKTITSIENKNTPALELSASEFISDQTDLPTLDSCDNIVLKNGNSISVLITEIGVDTIKYKYCFSSDGPEYAIPKSDVFSIQYKNEEDVHILKPKKEDNFLLPILISLGGIFMLFMVLFIFVFNSITGKIF